MKSLTNAALVIATERREEAWQRLCKATNEGAKKHWRNTYEKYATLVIKLNWRLEE